MSRQRKVSDAAHYIAQFCSFCAVMLGVMRVCSRDFRSRCRVCGELIAIWCAA